VRAGLSKTLENERRPPKVAEEKKSKGESQAQSQETVERNDPLDLGVPMLAGSEDKKERQGPEDALGAGPKRGDYRDRIGGSSYHPHTTEPIPDDELERDEDGNVTGPRVRVVEQRPRAEEIGDEPGKKGGVETDPLHPFNR
jgi:hypothetical protein